MSNRRSVRTTVLPRTLTSHQAGPTLKVIWVVAIICLTTGLGYEIMKTVAEFRQEHVAITMQQRVPTALPIVVVCLPSWLNRTKLEEIGRSDEVELLLRSMFIPEMSTAGVKNLERMNLNFPKMIDMSTPLSQRLAAARAVEEVGKNLSAKYLPKLKSRSSSLRKLVKDLQLDEVIQADSPMSTIEVRKFVNAFGGCYIVKPTTELSPMEIMFTALTIYVRGSAGVSTGAESTLFAFLGEGAEQSYPFGLRLDIPMNMMTSVAITAFHFSRVSLSNQPCKNWDERHLGRCLYPCFSRHLCGSSSNTCELINADIDQDIGRLCLFVKPSGHCLINEYVNNLGKFREIYHHCQFVCPLPCNSWALSPGYSYSVPPKGTNNRTTLEFRYYNPEASVSIIETRLYTWETLLANIGGMVSLFFGFSILSATQSLFVLVYRIIYAPITLQESSENISRNMATAMVK